MTRELDETDRKILRAMQKDGESSVERIAEAVGLSHTPVWRRIRRLQQEGIIKGRVWKLDAEQAGLDVSIFVFVRLSTHSTSVLEC